MITPTLKAKVKAQNRVNKQAIDFHAKIIEALRPFIGQKVLLASGGRTAKFNEALRRISDTDRFLVFDCSGNYIYARFKTCENVEGASFCVYAENSYDVGEMETHSNVLKSVNETAPTFRTDYTPEEIDKLRKAVSAARDTMNSLLHQVFSFGEYDN